MVEFEEYCELYDFIKGKEKGMAFFSGIMLCSILPVGIFTGGTACWFSGESTINFMIDHSDLKTLERIRMDFPEGSPQRDHADRRIGYLKKHGDEDISADASIGEQNKTVAFEYISGWLKKKDFDKSSNFYNKAGISRQLFSRMKNGSISITRDKAFHIALALGLNYEECEKFLGYLGYSFREWDIRDQIISYIVRTSKNYTLDFVDAMLILFKQQPFRSE